MSELLGVAAALIGSVLGGSAVAGTRYVVRDVDPLALTMLRYGIGTLFLLPFVLSAVRKLGGVREALVATGLGLLFFALYPFMFTLALVHTTAARGALALSAVPLLTLAFAIAFRRETFSWSRLSGILIAVGGLGYALSPRLGEAAPAVWKGDFVMVIAAAMQAAYMVLSRPSIERMGALPFTAFGMFVGALALLACSLALGVFDVLPTLSATSWAVIVYLGIFGCALIWVLWAIGLRLATPSLVGLTVTVNPLVASLLGVLFLSEPVGHELVVGLVAVAVGFAVAMNVLAPRTLNAR